MAIMARSVQSTSRTESAVSQQARPRGGLQFDWLFTLMCCWFIGGLHLDGWAHYHIPDLETFFTPWHAVLYSGYVVSAAVLVVALVRNHARGYTWRRALPPGYGVSLAGAAVFAVGGVLDMIWHLLFGIEVSVEALLSPTHLMLATGAVLIVTGPLRAAWQRLPGRTTFNWRTGLPALLSLTLLLSLLAFFTQFAHPFVDNWASINVQGTVTPFFDQALGIASILLQTTLLMAVVLLLVWRWALPFGMLTLLLAATTGLISVMHDQEPWIVVAVVAGLLADLLYRLLQPSAKRRVPLRVFAFVMPAILYGLYVIGMIIHDHGIGWSVHVWAGSTVMAGMVGLLLSYLVAPLQMPPEDSPSLDAVRLYP